VTQGGVYKVRFLRLFVQLSRPIFILSAALLYLLGIGIAHYLSGELNWQSFFLGFVWVIFILLGFQYLNEYFGSDSIFETQTWKHTPFSGATGAIGTGKLSRPVALWAGLIFLTISASLTVLIYRYIGLNLILVVILTMFIFGEFFINLPPFRLVASGYGEVIISIIMVGLIPAMAFLFQGHEFHRLLIMVTFPLTFLYLGMELALEFPDYASDIKQDKKPLLIRIGWQKGMQLHNLLILGCFVILGIAFLVGLPFRIGWSVFLALPVAIIQTWMMNRISDGAKPNWNLFELIALSTFGLTTYLLTYAFWTH
jgi:1,4-dihydroxy-2-naphthoate polyprenyltransferase